MKEQILSIPLKIYRPEELPEADRALVEAAREATRRSYAPYSHFSVGAAARLEDGTVVTGSNQENAAYPSGLCAERTTLFYAGAHHPELAVECLAIAARNAQGAFTDLPVTPCGACRQVMLETEQRFGRPMTLLMSGTEEIYRINGVQHLLPFAFDSEFL